MPKVTKQARNGGRGVILLLAAVGIACCAALPAATVTTEGTVLTIDVDAGESYTNSTALASPITEVVKTGAGTAVFTVASADFSGTINVNAGTAQFTVLDAYGTGPINVADGAAMVVSHNYTEQLITAVKGTVTIAGAGPDGTGALLFTGAGNADQIFQKVVLSANATWGGRRCGARTVDFEIRIASTVVKPDGEWHEYAIDLSRYTYWGGMVNELWFEGVDLRHATVEIDWMRFEP